MFSHLALCFRRQIVENMPDPLCPLFEELYLNVRTAMVVCCQSVTTLSSDADRCCQQDGQQEGLRRAAVRRAAKSGQPESWLPWTHQMDGPHYMTVNG